MSKSNQEIVEKFVESKAIDFSAIGKVVTELGPALSASEIGYRFVLLGRPFIIACLMPASDIRELVGELRNVSIKPAIEGANEKLI
jgi:hypothetical protein